MKSLYERLGRTEGIRALVQTVAEAHLANPTIAKRFEPVAQDPVRLQVALDHLSNFLESAAGGPAKYTGKSMIEAHKGMNISGEEYLAAMDDIMGALIKHNIDEVSRNEILSMLYHLKSTIVRV
jgi:hemoglobin